MKFTSSVVALTLLLASAVGALAADKSTERAKEAKQTKTGGNEKAAAKRVSRQNQVALTGSYIKRNVHRNGLVTDGVSPVVVLDSDTIRNSGAADLRELLVFRGVSR